MRYWGPAMETNRQNRLSEEWFDKALRQYGAVEPRPGLETRVLANLRAESLHVPRRGVWWLGLATVAAVLLIAADLFTMRDRQYVTLPVARVVPVAPQVQRVTQIVSLQRPSRPHGTMPSRQPPRLDQFPSPQPLSEQEEALEQYVEQFPREAVLVANAQTELLRNEEAEQQIHNEITPDLQDQNP